MISQERIAELCRIAEYDGPNSYLGEALKELKEAMVDRERLIKLIVGSLGPGGCACINDLPGDNYTCTSCQELYKIARSAKEGLA